MNDARHSHGRGVPAVPWHHHVAPRQGEWALRSLPPEELRPATPSLSVHLGALFGLLVIVAAGVAFAFGESGHQRQIDQALEPVLEEQSGKNGEATGADDSLFEITASIGQPGLEGRLKSARHSDGLLTLDVSMREFVELQRLDDNGRRYLLGLPAHCNPGITAMMAPTSTVRRLVALITCTGSLHR